MPENVSRQPSLPYRTRYGLATVTLAAVPTESLPEHPITLEERTDRIVGIVESAAIDVGHELIAAKADHPGRFCAWVDECLPFGIDKAERLMAVTRAFANATPDMLDALPTHAYSTLFELTRLPAARLQLAINNGDVHPDMTYRDARSLHDDEPLPDDPDEAPAERAQPRITADVVASELIRHPAANLSRDVEIALRRWLQ